ncbi:glycosyltransferase [Plectonema cf. radiosum LEGE 06105]|uniref:Glycosyltransferase n=1 Tax=Plectonema cf. radiosum LEGE 06105 TaxID=945769 RepID=A0A8J7FCL7_9CYAN|nr:glycosyltransferase [Plectonema radiosum]MBE9211796.1 glycosyltransferase [Plectonema cf. radiosum LEGE 06105]
MQTNLVKRVADNISVVADRIQGRLERRRMVSIQPDKPAIGNVLISYVVNPFTLKPGEPVPTSHTQHWECLQMAKTFLDFGYNVDVIWFYNDVFLPSKDYTFFIETRWNLQRCVPFLNKDCLKIFHSDTAHILFHNAAEANRLLRLQQRRGITLSPKRFEQPNQAIEYADCATVLGNEFTLNTFKYANKPLYRIPISAPRLYPFPEDKDFAACRKNFLWFGSGGLVHKGLDLLLDAFSQMPDYNLTICGPIEREDDFKTAFYQELYQTPNIHTIGWVDVNSQKFIDIVNSCLGIVYPTCSEGGGGCVINCMHTGLIPIVSYESSVDVSDDYGVILKENTVEEIKQSIQNISSLNPSQLEQMARKSWEFVRKNHTRDRFAQVYRETIEKIMLQQGIKKDLLTYV